MLIIYKTIDSLSVLYIVSPVLIIILSLVVDYLDGEKREKVCPVHPVRICWIMGLRVIRFFNLKNKFSHGVLLWSVTVLPLTMIYSVIPYFLLNLSFKLLRAIPRVGIIIYVAGIVVSSLLLKFTFSYKLLRWYVKSILELLKRGFLSQARVLLQEIVRRDVFAIHEKGLLISALIETYFESLVDGFISPLFWFSILDLPGAYIQRLANTMDSLVGYSYPPYDKIGYFSAKADTLINRVPAKLFSALLLSTCRARSKAKVVMRGALGINAKDVFVAVSSCLKIKLRKYDEYCIGDDGWELPDVNHIELSLKLSRRVLLIMLVVLLLICVIRQLVFMYLLVGFI